MPPCKQPRSLFQATLTHVKELLDLSCRNIEKTYGNYDKSDCRQQVLILQEYLLSNIPSMILDELIEVETAGSHTKQDLRIPLALYMHRNMRKFSVCTWSVYPKFDFHSEFLVERLIQMHNLVVLVLYRVCTDDILEAVGTNCHRLEEINIVSKLGLVYTTNEMDKAFNALKLKFFVSDVGLFYLRNCRLLRKVTMNRILRSHSGGCMMTVAGIRALVKSLPYLQNITYDDMGLVISEQMEDVQQLQLTHLCDFHPRPTNIVAAAQLCCSLQHLCLHFPNQSTVCTAKEILESLANSSLRVPILELIHFPFCIEMARLLERKGNFLRSLQVESTDYISLRAVHLIGQTCLSLRNLQLKQPLRDVNQSSSLETYKLFHTQHIFHNLHCLHLDGWNWNLAEVLPLCLLQAKHLETLFVTDMFSQKDQDDVMANIISTNPLQELKEIHMHTRQISIATIRYLIEHCPKLTVMSVVESANITSVQVKELRYEVHQKNLDLTITLVEAEPLG
ncbi:hypothetical protein B7P43_G17786 [Cryptotermes secundus]|uniref:F-box domain-containing protein n=2 Tax=Cryptotermes secundus TaxID=105785 RepID=A0A2J7QUH7_9NEOP|nr:uncharacterized protein LOC111865314 [Cryptotermes secundus]XP_023708992.1 uncharacterized protein LOC111865314 [Cryptotermes secundus]XP_033607664.1 uncharacterized protein LOC111865314 [Cryptotermes secundus]PNF32240.1 hypothetical protein B7P43_G17786 [Cryptotermes secundus]PNF32241.1 hypothetical protein B7P43_G17786 [Cryptotermes secundus]